jgi:hypothetical protein
MLFSCIYRHITAKGCGLDEILGHIKKHFARAPHLVRAPQDLVDFPRWPRSQLCNLTSVTLKSRSNQKPGSCILTKYIYLWQKFGDDPAISSGEIALFVFLVLAPWRPNQESDRTENLLLSTHDLEEHVYGHRVIALVRWAELVPAVTILTPNDQFSVIYIRETMSLRKIACSQFLRPATIRTRQILLGFYPLVKITSQFMSHDWEWIISLHGKSIVIRIILSKCLQIWPEQCGWEWWGYIQYMPYLASWRHRRCNTINAVPRQSFVIRDSSERRLVAV